MTKGTLKQPARDTIGAEAYASHVGLHPWSRAELRELSDNALLPQVRALPRNSELRAAACEILVDRYHKLVRSCVRQYRGSPEPTEDLMQVGYVGLLKAINNCPAHLPVRRHGGDGLTASGVNGGRTLMKTGMGLTLIGAGAILAFAVTTNTSVFNLHTAGYVIMLIGILGLAIPRRGYGWVGRRLFVRQARWRPGLETG